jgi:hypothetical protein
MFSTLAVRSLVRRSSQGESSRIGLGAADLKTSMLTIRCTHVVPHFEYVPMMMSSGRGLYACQRALSMMRDLTARLGALRSSGVTTALPGWYRRTYVRLKL